MTTGLRRGHTLLWYSVNNEKQKLLILVTILIRSVRRLRLTFQFRRTENEKIEFNYQNIGYGLKYRLS